MNNVTFLPTARPTYSKWDRPDHCEQIAPGIWSVSTPSHGGFMLSPQRIAAMPELLRACAPDCKRDGSFEEDCEWALVVLAFPECFDEPHLKMSRQCIAMTSQFKFPGFNAEPWLAVLAAYAPAANAVPR